MYTTSELFAKMIQIVFINLVLSGDNVAIISLSVKNLPVHKAKLVSMIGVILALIFRIFFVAIIGVLFNLKWLHLNLVGGIILILVTINMFNHEKSTSDSDKDDNEGFMKALFSIIISDISMSLDNVLAITSITMADSGVISRQEMTLIIFGTIACMPIIFFGSEAVSKLMNKCQAVIYLCAGLLVYTATKMILSDSIVSNLINKVNPVIGLAVIVIMATILIVIMIKDKKKSC
ncbi:YjbE family putative metal transport protein [Clostridium sp. YIM B02506]|jgi:YjbE family integral membrane protein|uniref:YjbE family putative metal transport protein n=1 Tax=Clostridium sp. YIM B02506 TaxID=2910680 RepID=UPI001EEF650A|nr:YjbE family putative metal transport protein [Clostridium sp. YIM B02506]